MNDTNQTNPLVPQDKINQIKDRLARVTLWPWRSAWNDKVVDYDDPIIYSVVPGVVRPEVVSLMEYDGLNVACLRKDSEFIAHSPEDVDWLLNQLEAALTEITKLKAGN